MIKKIFFIWFFWNPIFHFAQQKGAISIEVNTSYRQFSMNEFNRAISIRRANSYSEANITKTTNVENGYGHGLSLNLQLTKLIGVGLYSEYAKGSSVTEYNYIVGGENGVPIDTWYRVDNHDLHSLTLGLKTQFFINKLDFWERNSWLSKIESVIEIGGGYGLSRADIYITSPDKESVGVGSMKEFNRVSGIHFMANFKTGFKILNNSIFSTIGLTFGYQYLKTNRLQGGEGEYHNYFFSKENTPKLDFSGFSTGIYLTFGK
ncbi:MAG: hypothetical protein WED10_12200 [Brumimicrobium sp.]